MTTTYKLQGKMNDKLTEAGVEIGLGMSVPGVLQGHADFLNSTNDDMTFEVIEADTTDMSAYTTVTFTVTMTVNQVQWAAARGTDDRPTTIKRSLRNWLIQKIQGQDAAIKRIRLLND